MRWPSPHLGPTARRAVLVLLVIAVIGRLWVPITARSGPALGPFPFFYCYQLIWVPATAVRLWSCYLLLKKKPRR